MWIAERLDNVVGSKRRLRENKLAAAIDAADGTVWQLQPELHGVQQRAAVDDIVEEEKAFAVLVQVEPGMNSRCAIGVVGENDEVIAVRANIPEVRSLSS